MSDTSQGPGWWQAADTKWYPPEQAPGGPPAGAAGPGAAPVGGPPGGAPAAGSLAEWPQRVIATLIDSAAVVVLLVAVFIVAAILGAISSALALIILIPGYLAALALGFYFFYLTGETGQSPGKRLIGIKVVAESTGQPIGGGGGIIRYFAHIPDSICLIGYLFPLWDEKKQTFADKIQKTVVLSNIPKQDFGPDIFKP